MYFEYDDKKYPIEIIRKNNKNLYIRVSDDLKILVYSPRLFTKLYIKKIISDNERSVIKMINKQESRMKKEILESSCLLGNKINIIYEDTRKPIFSDNTLIVKDSTMLDKWYKNMCIIEFKNHMDKIYNMFEEKIPYPILKVRKMKTRWGVCNRKNNSVSLNFDLIKKDPKYLDYVIIHELSHFVYFNHSKYFWMEVEKYCPDYKIIRKGLK